MFHARTLVAMMAAMALTMAGCAKKTSDADAKKGAKAQKESAKKTPEKSDAKKGAAKPASADKKAAKPAASADSTAAKASATGPIAVVNGVKVARSEFDRKYGKMTRAFTKRKKTIPAGLAQRYKESILRQLIDKEVLRQEIAKQKITVDDAKLAQELTDYKKMFRTEKNFARYLKSSDITLDQIKANLKHNQSVRALLEKQGNLVIKDDEVRKYYDEHKKRYELKSQVRASHILIKTSARDDKTKQKAAKAKAEEVYTLAKKANANFADLAKKYSQGPTAARGGDLNFFTKGRMVPAFEKVAFTMKKNDISKPVKTQFGWHVIKVTDKKEGRQRGFDEVKAPITKLLTNKKSRRAKADLLKKLKGQAKIESFLPKPKVSPVKRRPTVRPGIHKGAAPKKATKTIQLKGAKTAPKPTKK